MQKPASNDNQERIRNKVKLTIKVNYFTSFVSIIFFVLCITILKIYEIIPYIFLAYGILNLLNILFFKYHQKITIMYNMVSIMTLIGTTSITLYSGGINSPFIFLLALVVFTGYVTTRVYGRIYFNLILLIVVLIYSQSVGDFSFTQNVVPEKSKDLFALISIMFSIYLLGDILGKNLLNMHQKLYKSKSIVEEQVLEKEMLIKEIHHRVKNNLQTVSSLLSLQSRSLSDNTCKALVKSSQNRVISMAMVHEMLYMRDDITKINCKTYIQDLSEYLIRSMKGVENQIDLQTDIAEVELGIDTAIPLGLIVNEIITNTLKYGISENDKGVIEILLKKEENINYSIQISDDGPGFPDDINPKNIKSLGLKLIYNLTRQLKGSITRDLTKKGTHYNIRFQEIGKRLEDPKADGSILSNIQ